MKLHAESKIVIGFVAVVGILYGGYQFYSHKVVADLHFTPVVPGEVNMVGIDPGAGYKIIVANEMAQLVESSGDFEASDSSGGGPDSGAVKKRIPIKEMLGVFRGDSKSLGDFVSSMNEMKENEKWPTTWVIWKSEDVNKAFAGDASLKKKLEQDLNVKLDGTPLSTLRPASMENGIILDYPITLDVDIQGKLTPVTGRLRQPYKPKLLQVVSDRLAEKVPTPQMMAGYYSEEATKLIEDPSKRENIKAGIDKYIAPVNVEKLKAGPERVLKSATVVVNEHQITGSEYKAYEAGGDKFCDMTINLTDEGQKRLWKYSIDRVPSNLMLIVDGVAIAAPRIVRPLTESELTIRRMPDEVLVKDAVSRLNKATNSPHG